MNDKVNEAIVSPPNIGDIDGLWLAAINYRLNGVNDVQAMDHIYDALPASLGFQDMANVFSGVYCDAYWETDREKPAILAQHMTQALSIALTSSTQYANKAMQQWRGVLCRKNFGDNGVIPTIGAYTDSPDIICNQDVELSPAKLIDNWNTEFWKVPKVGKNYIYTRCQNKSFFGKINDAKVRMYYANGGFNQPPSSWIQCLTVSGKNKDGKVLNRDGRNAILTVGERGASEGFMLDLKSTQHICLIATVSYPFFTENNPLQFSEGNWNSVQWILYNGAGAWRNVTPVSKSGGEESLTFHNQDSTPEQFSFSMRCRRVPEGSTLRMYSDDPAAAFDTRRVKVLRSSQELNIAVQLPPHYAGHIKVQLEGPDGKPLPSSAAVQICMHWCVPHSSPHYLRAAAMLGALEAVPTLQSLQLPVGYFTFVGAGD